MILEHKRKELVKQIKNMDFYNAIRRFIPYLEEFQSTVCGSVKHCLGCRLNEECASVCALIELTEFLKKCRSEIGVFVGEEEKPSELPDELNVFDDNEKK
jgi:hypothetical protein